MSHPALSRTALAAAALLLLMSNAAAQKVLATAERRSTQGDQQSVAVTIYNEDLALVKEVRNVALDAGVNRIALRDVSARLRPETALLRSLSHPGSLELLEQNFDFDLLTPEQLLAKHVGQTVRVVKTHYVAGVPVETLEPAQVLAASNGMVLKIGDRIETGAPGRIVFDAVPANLRDRPTLVSELQSKRAGAQQLELSYLSGGLSWQADYVAELSADDSALDLNGWVTLNNRSGTAYSNAKLQLVAGDVNRVREQMQRTRLSQVMADAAAPAKAVAQESLFEYHLYTLGRATTLADNQTKQVALLSATAVPTKKELVLQGSPHYYSDSVGSIGTKIKVGVFMEFANRESARLGMPLPKGVVRVYKRDSAGNAQFVGEDRIEHTPKNEVVRLNLGNAFDVTADKKQTDFRRREPGLRAHESAYEIVLRNAKTEAASVMVREPVPGDWTMLEESSKHEKVAAGTAQWRVNVPAGGSTTLRYRVVTRW